MVLQTIHLAGKSHVPQMTITFELKEQAVSPGMVMFMPSASSLLNPS